MLKNFTISLVLVVLTQMPSWAKEEIFPTVEPANFKPTDEITVTYDVTGTILADLDDAWIWVWIPGATSIDAKYNVNPASSNSALSDNSKFQKTEDGGNTFFSITFKPEDFFAQPICLETKLGMLIKGDDWADGQSVDEEKDMMPLETCFVVDLISPTSDPVFLSEGESLYVLATSSEQATFTLLIDGQQVDLRENTTYFSSNQEVPQVEGLFSVSLQVANAENDTTINFDYLVNFPSVEMARPAGVIPGINYSADDTRATLCLYAPGKEAAYLQGEFNDFGFTPQNRMYRDGDYFWMEVDNLVAGQEYAYRYLVDGAYIADPFSDKILTVEDSGIPESTYPNLKEFPEEAREGVWYKDKLSIVQTGQQAFDWQNNDYQKPAVPDLVIYELLMRDFFGPDGRNYELMIDTLSYFKRLGINAIELMPIMEFNGNDNWGYQPHFMFAPDKSYGTKDALKRFIDAAHGEGIAVILDIVFNQQDTPNPYISLWFDYNTMRVKPENPMFNVNATHPYNVFTDMNHESEMTQYYMDTTLHYWLNEYQVDGFRFDLSKGFTQTNSGDNVGVWGQYDQSRIDLLTRMYDEVREYSTDSYLILEHFADNSEETVLANYGFMLWGNGHWDYKDLLQGKEKDIGWFSHINRGWEEPNLVAYMESHDEQRLMDEMIRWGESTPDYDTRNLYTALNRIKMASTIFYTIPGPKLLWQFGEFGYDVPRNLCPDGVTIGNGDDCKTNSKPTKWEYLEEENHLKLFKVVQELIKLKKEYAVYKTGTFEMRTGRNFVKDVILMNQDGIAAPSSADEMSVYAIANFGIENQTYEARFPFTGTWYSYFEGGEPLEVTNAVMSMELEPGQFALYFNFEIDFPEEDLIEIVTSIPDHLPNSGPGLTLYPNPADDVLKLSFSDGYVPVGSIEILDLSGKIVFSDSLDNPSEIDISQLPKGVYLLQVMGQYISYTQKFIKN